MTRRPVMGVEHVELGRGVVPDPDEHLIDPVERRIREAIDAGEFDDLPGAGRPLPDIDMAYDPGWWARRWLEGSRRSDAADELRRLIRHEVPRLQASGDRGGAERRVAELNALVAEVNAGLPQEERIAPVVLSG